MNYTYLSKNFYLPVILIFFLFSASLSGQNSHTDNECFMIMAGTKATQYNSVLIGHNNDLTGNEVSYLKKYPRMQHDSGKTITFSNGLTLEMPNISNSWMVLQTEKGFKEGDAIAVNEHQVAIGGGVSLKADRNELARKYDPLVDTGVTGGIRYLVLQKATSAREAVQMIGEYYNKYGISYPSGIAIADKEEIWYMEAGGGHHWAAIKIPDDACWIQANGYRIDQVNPKNENTMASPGLLEFAKNNGMWNPDEELFSFKKIFGGKTHQSEENPYYNSRRVWRAIEHIAPSMLVGPKQKYFPSFIRPDEKIRLNTIMDILRDEYDKTPYYPYDKDTTGTNERPVASSRTVHSSIVQLRSGFPATIGAVIWTGLSSPVVTPYVPIYFGINEIPAPYSAKVPDKEKAFHYFKQLADIYYSNPVRYKAHFPAAFQEFQKKTIQDQRTIDKNAYRLYRTSRPMAIHMLTVSLNNITEEALEIAQQKLKEIDKEAELHKQ
jgi:dipeptidase